MPINIRRVNTIQFTELILRKRSLPIMVIINDKQKDSSNNLINNFKHDFFDIVLKKGIHFTNDDPKLDEILLDSFHIGLANIIKTYMHYDTTSLLEKTADELKKQQQLLEKARLKQIDEVGHGNSYLSYREYKYHMIFDHVLYKDDFRSNPIRKLFMNSRPYRIMPMIIINPSICLRIAPNIRANINFFVLSGGLKFDHEDDIMLNKIYECYFGMISTFEIFKDIYANVCSNEYLVYDNVAHSSPFDDIMFIYKCDTLEK
jgi:hypothetical protein